MSNPVPKLTSSSAPKSFAALTCLAAVAMGWGEPARDVSLTDHAESSAGFTLPSLLNDSRTAPSICAGQPGAQVYSFVPKLLNSWFCWAWIIWSGVWADGAGNLLVKQLEHFLWPTVLCLIFEANRPSSATNVSAKLKQYSLVFFLAAQGLSGAVVLPIYFALTAHANGKSPAYPLPAQSAWISLVSAVVGYLLPCKWLRITNGGYNALAIWQVFPIWVAFMSMILSTATRAVALPWPSRHLALLAAATIGVVTAALDHWKMMRSIHPWSDILVLHADQLGRNVKLDAQRLFAVDFAFIWIALSAHLLISCHRTAGRTALLGLAYLTATALVGAGGAASLLLAYREWLATSNEADPQKRA